MSTFVYGLLALGVIACIYMLYYALQHKDEAFSAVPEPEVKPEVPAPTTAPIVPPVTPSKKQRKPRASKIPKALK